MQKRSRVSGSDSSAAKRARLQHPKYRARYEPPLAGRASGLSSTRWRELLQYTDGYIEVPPEMYTLLTEDGSKADREFLQYAASQLETHLSGEEHQREVEKEWYCCKVFIFQSLEQLRTDLIKLFEIRGVTNDISARDLLKAALGLEENLWLNSTQYIYALPIGRLLESYLNELGIPLMQPILAIFVTNRLSQFLWPLFKPLFKWEFINLNATGFSTDDSVDSRDQKVQMADELDQLNPEELLLNNIHIPADLARHAVKQIILNGAESIRENQINVMDIKAKEPPISASDQPLLFVENPAMITRVGNNMAICSGTDSTTATVGMHRALVRALSTRDVDSFEVAFPWANAPSLAIDLTEICLDPAVIRQTGLDKNQPAACGFGQLQDLLLSEESGTKDPAADLICRIANVASSIYRVYALLKKVNREPLSAP